MKDNLFIMSLARKDDGTSKISLRITGNPENVDLKDIVAQIVERTGGEAGGHQHAAGAVIETIKEDEFIEHAKKMFDETKF